MRPCSAAMPRRAGGRRGSSRRAARLPRARVAGCRRTWWRSSSSASSDYRRDRRADRRRTQRRCPRRSQARAPRGSASRPTSPAACVRPASSSSRTTRSRPQQLDELDGALTTCAAACAVTGTIALDGGPGQGRRAIDAAFPTCTSASCGTSRSSRPCPSSSRRLELRSARGGRPHRPRLGAVRDLGHRARSGSRVSTARGGSSSCWWRRPAATGRRLLRHGGVAQPG